MLKTLAGKHRSMVTKMARRYKTTIESPTGPRTVFQVSVARDRGRKPLLARFGGISSGEHAQPTSPTSGESWPAPAQRADSSAPHRTP